MFPDCIVKLVENKEESLEFAIKRINELNLQNCIIYKGNLNNFVGKFDVGVAVHSCGTLADLIIEKCLQSKADIIVCPCCYGSIKQTKSDDIDNHDKIFIKYPRSNAFEQALITYKKEQMLNQQELLNLYYILTNYSDRTEKDILDEERGYLCMSLIDSDRLLYLKENGYSSLDLIKIQPEECSTKNDLLIAKFSK